MHAHEAVGCARVVHKPEVVWGVHSMECGCDSLLLDCFTVIQSLSKHYLVECVMF